MNAIDGTDHVVVKDSGPPPSLLTIIIDTNPFAWAHISSQLSLSQAIANLLVFINAHLAVNNTNEVAVLASHTQRAEFLYPAPDGSKARKANGDRSPSDSNGDVDMSNGGSGKTVDHANKYRPFRIVEEELYNNLDRLLSNTTPPDLQVSTTTQLSGALTMALAYISKANMRDLPPDPTYSSLEGAGHSSVDQSLGLDGNRRATRTSRVFVLSVSGDLAEQYIPVMNAIFAAQRQNVSVDIMKLAGDTLLLQQACDATGGIYIAPKVPQGMLQYLMMAFLPDSTARRNLVNPSEGEVDFRAACFCHRDVVDIGYVCSVCLSIFCSVPPDETCLTCGTKLSPSRAFNAKPALIPRKKKKRKRLPGEATPAGGTPLGGRTPIPGGTPGP